MSKKPNPPERKRRAVRQSRRPVAGRSRPSDAPDPRSIEKRRPRPKLTPSKQRQLDIFEQLVAEARHVLFDADPGALEGSGPATDTTRNGSTARGARNAARVLQFARRRLAKMVTTVQQDNADVPSTMLTAALKYFCLETLDWLQYQQNLVRSLLESEPRSTFSQRLAEDLEHHVRLAELGQAQGTLRRDVDANVLGTFMHRFSVGWTMMVWIRGVPPTPEAITAQFAAFVRTLRPPEGPDATAVSKGRSRGPRRKSRSASKGGAEAKGKRERRRRT